MVFLSRSGSSVGSSNLPSCFSTFTSSSHSGNAHGPHVPCDPTNASTPGALGYGELNTLGVASYVELQGTLGAISSIELQGTKLC
jgi:hypothetical protein